ncbi:MAG: hypothetical protein QS721_08520 [Candidatus Endonucleobacter sp. (ex Gigantidas childressi)]|nr:hypothetical protein [Candidatus Endonucleobacter sp. (ex Gigantidas childressi)]
MLAAFAHPEHLLLVGSRGFAYLAIGNALGIKRFFADYDYSFEQLGELILSCLEMDRFILCMDRTNWKHGSKNVNYLVVSIAWQGASIPIVWECLDKKKRKLQYR